MSEWRIPFNRTDLAGEELRYVSEAVAHGHLSGDGPFGSRCEALLENTLESSGRCSPARVLMPWS